MATMPIAVDGSYQFDGSDGVVPNSNYSIVLSTFANGSVPNLPTNWNNADGENMNSSSIGNDGVPDGKIEVAVGLVDLLQVDFGINHAPTADDKSEPLQANLTMQRSIITVQRLPLPTSLWLILHS